MTVGRKLVAVLAAGALVLGACGGDAGGDDDTIKIGVLAPLTGGTAADGEDMIAGAKLAVDEINDDGGIDGRKLELVKGDTQDQRPDAVSTAVTRLTRKEQVDAAMTGYASGTNFEINLMRDAEVPYLLSANSDQTEQIIAKDPDSYPNVWSINPSYDAYRNDLPAFVESLADQGKVELRNRRVYIVTSDNPYSAGISEGLEKAFAASGWTVVGNDKVPFGTVNDWRAILGKIRREDPDLVVNTDYQPANGATFIQQFREQPTNSLVFIQYGPSVPEFLELTKDDATGVLYNLLGGPIETQPRAKEIARKFEDEYGREPGPYGFTLYEQVHVYADAVRKAGDPSDVDAVNEALAKTDKQIAEGHLRFDPKTHLAVQGDDALPTQWFQIRDGKRILLAPRKYANGEFRLPDWMSQK